MKKRLMLILGIVMVLSLVLGVHCGSAVECFGWLESLFLQQQQRHGVSAGANARVPVWETPYMYNFIMANNFLSWQMVIGHGTKI
jgi:hypothetical protein